MFDTSITLIGNVLTAPEWRRTNDGTLVTNFRVASTARRMDRDTNQWVDGKSLRLRVTCWRRLAEGVGASLMVGDPVLVTGRIFSRDWVDGEGRNRISYEMEAVSVGHDLSRGKGRFYRRSSEPSAAEGEEAGDSVPVSDQDVPVAFGDGVPDGDEPIFTEFDTRPGTDPQLEIEVEAIAAEPSPRTRRARREAVSA